MNHKKKIRLEVFLPPWILLAAVIAVSLINYDALYDSMALVAGWITNDMAWLLNSSGIMCLVVLLVIYVSKFSKVKIGGAKAEPIVNKRNWRYITLTTTIGAGLLFFASSEPLLHFMTPPANITEGSASGAAAIWAMETLYLEWTWVPYAIYTVAALMFAFVFYNMRKKQTLSAVLIPVLGEQICDKISPLVDAVCLFSLVLGVASAMGVGAMNIAGGLENTFGIKSESKVWFIIIIAIVLTFLLSAISGITKGISKLANLNVNFYWFLIVFLLVFGPTFFILNFGVETVGSFLADFFRIASWTSSSSGDGWAGSWPVYYLCAWYSWTPVTAVFLGRISKGYTVREVITTNLIFPAIFSTVWIALFGGAAIYYESAGAGLYDIMTTSGMESVVYNVFKQMPFSVIVIPIYIFVVFISFVTATNSNTTAMAGLCVSGIDCDDAEAPTYMKVIWAVTVGVVTFILLQTNGIDGIKMACNVAGLPICILEIGMVIGLVKIMKNPWHYDYYKEDYDEKEKR